MYLSFHVRPASWEKHISALVGGSQADERPLKEDRWAWGFVLGRPGLRSQSLSYVLGREPSRFLPLLFSRGTEASSLHREGNWGMAWAPSFLCFTPDWVKYIHLMDFHQITFSWSSNGLRVGPRDEWNQAPALEKPRPWAWAWFR